MIVALFNLLIGLGSITWGIKTYGFKAYIKQPIAIMYIIWVFVSTIFIYIIN